MWVNNPSSEKLPFHTNLKFPSLLRVPASWLKNISWKAFFYLKYMLSVNISRELISVSDILLFLAYTKYIHLYVHMHNGMSVGRCWLESIHLHVWCCFDFEVVEAKVAVTLFAANYSPLLYLSSHLPLPQNGRHIFLKQR